MYNTSKLEKAIEQINIGGNTQFHDCFDNFLNIALSYFCNNMDERQMFLRKLIDEDERLNSVYKNAILEYSECASDYHDPIGDIFMTRISHGDHGQFFTPESISTVMAELTMNDNLHDGIKISDPTCGTGRTLLMALKHLRETKNIEPELYANDLSMTCAKMTLLNFCMNSVSGKVSCGNSLLLDYDNFTFFKLDKIMNIESGQILTTYWQYKKDETREIIEKRNKWWWWIAKYGWIEFRNRERIDGAKKLDEDATDIMHTELSTEIKFDEKGQISLF